MKKTLTLALGAFLLAGPVLACDAMKDSPAAKPEARATLKTARKAKLAKTSKAAKPLAEGKTADRKI